MNQQQVRTFPAPGKVDELSRESSGDGSNIPNFPNFPEAESACAHAGARLTVRMIKKGLGGEYMTWWVQCPRCGASGGAIAGNKLTGAQKAAAVPFDEGSRDRWWAEASERRRAELERERETERDDWRRRYEDYIKTSWNWKVRLRGLVMARCNGVCEGCGERTAVQVHHMTYEHLGDEFLWELKGVCRECHEKFHGIEPFHPGVEDGAF